MARKTEQEIYRSRVNPEKIAAYRAANPEASEREARAALRGHGTSLEHGKVTTSKPFYTMHGDLDRVMTETRSGQKARSILASLAKQGRVVSIEVFTKDGPKDRPQVYIERGKPVDPSKPERVEARWLTIDKDNPDRVNGERNLKKWLEKQWMPLSGHDSPGFQPRNITRIRIFEHFR